MARAASPSRFWPVLGWLMLLVGVSVFAIRLHQPGPYALPRGGNLVGGLGALGLGVVFLARGFGAAAIRWLALLASPVVLFLALYATFAELEEVVVLIARDASGAPADLRLWVVDRDGAAWVTMPRAKADAHGLTEARVELLRDGELACVVATRHEDRATVDAIHRLRHEKYAVQRFATLIGMFGRTAGADTVALRLDPCPSG